MLTRLLLLTMATAPALAADLPPHPRLLFNRAGLEGLKQRVARPPWREVWAGFKAGVAARLGQSVDLPPRGGNWSHNYVCPEHGARLKRGRQLGPWRWEHLCPIGPHTLVGDPARATHDFDGNAIAAAHGTNAQEVCDLGLVYQLTGDPRYAQRADALLLAYADKYLTYPLHNNQGKPVKRNGGRIASQPLTEASTFIPLAQGADLVWDTLTAAQRETLEQRLFRPALTETILNDSATPVIHNIQCRRNSAVGLIGYLFGDARLIHEAIDGVSGYRAQMAKGVQADGVWFEGAWGYHFFTLNGLVPLTEAARNCGLDLYGPELKRLFDAPFALATPDFTLPAFNDSGEEKLANTAALYELAFARYRNPVYASLLSQAPRTSTSALWFGVDELPTGRLPSLGSRNAEASGYAILQRGDGREATWACLKYGPHGGGHGHFDKLNLVLWSRGQMLGLDSGTHAYGSALHRDWDKTTLAHNTLTVDESDQAPATGRCRLFGSQGGVDYVMADAGPVYAGVELVRTVLLLDADLLVVVDQAQAKEPRLFDVAYHLRGAWGALPAGTPWSSPRAPGYKCLTQTTTRTAADGLDLPLVNGERKLLVSLAPGAATEVITGLGLGASTADLVPTVLFRRRASSSTWVWSIALDGVAPRLLATPAADGAVKLSVGHGAQQWQVLVDSRQPRLAVGG